MCKGFRLKYDYLIEHGIIRVKHVQDILLCSWLLSNHWFNICFKSVQDEKALDNLNIYLIMYILDEKEV